MSKRALAALAASAALLILPGIASAANPAVITRLNSPLQGYLTLHSDVCNDTYDGETFTGCVPANPPYGPAYTGDYFSPTCTSGVCGYIKSAMQTALAGLSPAWSTSYGFAGLQGQIYSQAPDSLDSMDGNFKFTDPANGPWYTDSTANQLCKVYNQQYANWWNATFSSQYTYSDNANAYGFYEKNTFDSPSNNSVARYSNGTWSSVSASVYNWYDWETLCYTASLPTATLTASSYAIQAGQSTTLFWNQKAYSESCTASSNWPYNGSPSGQVNVSPSTTTTYTYTCSNGNGTVENDVTITVNGGQQQQGSPTASLTPPSQSVVSRGSATLNYSCTNSTSASIDGAVGPVALPSGTVTVNPRTTTTYTLTCSNGATSARASAVVNVIPKPTVTFTASPTTVAPGGSSKLTWSSTNATSCTGAGFNAKGATSNAAGVSVTPGSTTTFSITCTGPGGSATKSATVTVSSTPAPTVTFTATPPSIPSGGTSNLTWSSTNADSCTGTGFSTGNATNNTSPGVNVSPAVTTTYTISCTGSGGTTSRSATVTVGGEGEGTPSSGAPDLTTGGVTVNPGAPVSGQSTTLSAGITNLVDKALSFNGSTQYTTAANVTNIGVGFTGTITFWAKGSGVALSNDRSSARYREGYVLVNGDGSLTYGVDSNTGAPFVYSLGNTTSANTGSWNFYAVSVSVPASSGTMTGTLYVNGVQQGRSTAMTLNGADGGFTTIDVGRRHNYNYDTEYFSGALDDVRIYNRQLATAEIQDIYENSNPTASGLVAYWPFDDTTGTDLSGAGHTATLVNNPALVTGGIGASTGSTNFVNLFQIDNDSDHNAIVDSVTSAAMNNLAAGATQTATASYTFPIAGTYYLRACADMDDTMTGVIDESNEDNNCGDWSLPISVTSGTPITASCTASPDSGKTNATAFTFTATAAGGTGTYHYSWTGSAPLTNADSPTRSGIVYTTSGAKSATVTVTDTAGGSSGPIACKTSTGDGSVSVTDPTPTATLTAEETNLNIGQSTTLHWSSTNATSCTGTGFSTGAGSPISGNASTGALSTPGNYTYQLQCTGSGGTSNLSTVTITVHSPAASISANPTRVTAGNTTTLTWSAAGVTKCSVFDSHGTTIQATSSADAAGQWGAGSSPLAGSGTAAPPVNSQTTYTIYCDTGGGSVSSVTSSTVVNTGQSESEF